MKKPVVIVLASNATQWSSFHSSVQEAFDIRIISSIQEIHQIALERATDLLIISFHPEREKTIDTVSIANALRAGCTLIVSPEPTRADIGRALTLVQCVLSGYLAVPAGNYPTVVEGPCLQVPSEGAPARRLLKERCRVLFGRLRRSWSREESVHRIDRPALAGESPTAIIRPPAYVIRPDEPQLDGRLLGRFQVRLNGLAIDEWAGKKAKSLMAYLLYHRKAGNLRDVLMEQFWPGVSQESARNSLHVTLHGIRKAFKRVDAERDYILYDSGRYRLNPDVLVEVDYEAFMGSWSEAQRLERYQGIEQAIAAYERTAALYRGDFIEDELYEDWICTERATIREAYLFTLDRLSAYYFSRGRFADATTVCQTILQKDECRENVHRRLMRCYYRTGRRDHAIRQFHRCARVLETELDVTPSRPTLDLYAHILQETLINDEDTLWRQIINN